MITTVTLNPCVHKITSFAVPLRGPVVFPVKCRYQAGGKGINVARAAKRLGAPVRAISTSGGHVGGLLRDALVAEGLVHQLVPVAAPTRMSTFIFSERTQEFREYLEPGEPLTPAERDTLLAAVLEASTDSDLLVLSGSSPCSLLDGFFATVVEELKGAPCLVAVDTYGPPARQVVAGTPPYLFKSNREELARSFNIDVRDPRELERFANALLERGAQFVAVTDGDAAATLFGTNGRTVVWPPRIRELNPVGSGDALLGAMAVRLGSGSTPAEAFRYGVAAGAVNAQRLDVCALEPEAVGALLAETHLRESPAATLPGR
ncbi:MAG: PfkB family carbohydrate kinase [Planctomycetota bacterium]